MSDFEFLGFLVVCFVGGVLAVHKTGVDLGVIDHGSIVWDEIVPFWLVLLFCPDALVVADDGLLPLPLFRHQSSRNRRATSTRR
jgi:phosphatidylglycerophosphatase A